MGVVVLAMVVVVVVVVEWRWEYGARTERKWKSRRKGYQQRQKAGRRNYCDEKDGL
jgi:hypothetical protein